MLVGLRGSSPLAKGLQPRYYNILLHNGNIIQVQEATLDEVKKPCEVVRKGNGVVIEVEETKIAKVKKQIDVHETNLDESTSTLFMMDYEKENVLKLENTNTKRCEYPYQKEKGIKFGSINKMMAFDDLANHPLTCPKTHEVWTLPNYILHLFMKK